MQTIFRYAHPRVRRLYRTPGRHGDMAFPLPAPPDLVVVGTKSFTAAAERH
jgi:hypothetical protein